jgi:cytochrome oxidase Cu insertion factor (SCO1/SenC/PrrC family)
MKGDPKMARDIIFKLTFLVVFAIHPAWSHTDSPHTNRPPSDAVKVEAADMKNSDHKARRYFTDLPVVTSNGKEQRFFTDILKDRVVLISLFYTQCSEACPLTTNKVAQVQDLLGEALGRDFFLVSISLDPKTDTPAVIKKYAAKFGAREGWIFLTGKVANLKQITYRLGHTSPNIEAHNTRFILGNVGQEHWVKLRPDLPAEHIATRLRMMHQIAGPGRERK